MASGIETYFQSVIAEPGRAGIVPTLLRGFLGGASNLYDAGLEAYLFGEKIGLRRREKLPVPIVSIGNLTVGGTGKTPMTQTLCRRLQAAGKRVAVLSRGHGGDSQETRLVSDGSAIFLTAAQAGDEPVLLARTLPGIPVFVGKDRRQSGREALRRFDLDVLVLDDGFQFWQLARDLDIVLLDAARPFDNGFPLPRGLLREPKRHLNRAQIVVVTRADALSESKRDALRRQISRLAPEALLFFACHQATGLRNLSPRPPSLQVGGAEEGLPSELPLPGGKGAGGIGLRRIVALSGIAQPDAFVRTLKAATSVEIVGQLTFADHAVYTVLEVEQARKTVTETGADALVMTEKDAVKWPDKTGKMPTYALQIEACVENEAEFLDAVTARFWKKR